MDDGLSHTGSSESLSLSLLVPKAGRTYTGARPWQGFSVRQPYGTNCSPVDRMMSWIFSKVERPRSSLLHIRSDNNQSAWCPW